MTWQFSPTINDGDGMWSGGGGYGFHIPWWHFPTPLGVPKSQIPYGCSYIERFAPNGEMWEQPVAGGIIWPWSEHQIKGDGAPGWCAVD